jgi:hypothetical protein
MIPIFKTHGVRLGAKEIWDDSGGDPYQGLKTTLNGISKDPALQLVTGLGILISNSDRDELESKLRNKFWRTDVLDIIKTFAEKAPVKMFSDISYLVVLQMIRSGHLGSEKSGDSVEKTLEKLGKALLYSNELASTYSSRADEDPESYIRFSCREILFNHEPQLRYTLARSYLIYEHLKPSLTQDPDFIDINLEFKNAFNFELSDFFDAIFCVYSYWGQQSIDKWDPSYTVINPTVVFPQNKGEQLLRVLKELSADLFCDLQMPQTDAEWRQFVYEFFDLKRRPLLLHEGVYYCSILRFVQELYWNGPYYLLIDSISDQAKKKRLFRYLGKAQEIYIQKIAHYSFGKKFKILKTPQGHPLGDGCIELKANQLVVLESKASRPSRELISGTELPKETTSAKKMLYDGLEQLSDRIQEYIKGGYTGRVFPVLITGGYFPLNPQLWDHFLEKTRGLFLFNNPQIAFPLVIDIEAFEIICASRSAGMNILKLLQEKARTEWQKEGFNAYLYHHYFPSQKKSEPPLPVLLDVFHHRMYQLSKSLFPDKELKKIHDTNSWKEVFK